MGNNERQDSRWRKMMKVKVEKMEPWSNGLGWSYYLSTGDEVEICISCPGKIKNWGIRKRRLEGITSNWDGWSYWFVVPVEHQGESRKALDWYLREVFVE